MTSSYVAAADPLVGSRIDGRYTVFGMLGQGGMGVVYDGVHDELGRPVAIKVLNAAWAADRTAVERFLREARTASSFSHGNIVDVSDLGRLSDGRPYLVMPKINGVDLATLLADNGPQPAKRVAALLTGVAAALDLVHAKGYVHRDIKPENLMYVVREDGTETVMLLDFGIAAAMMSSGPRLTRQGAIFGTPQYLPPEVCTGGRPDARGDVYALAGVAFELITGALLFPIDDIMQLMAAKVSHDAPTLSAATCTPFPPEIEAIIARGLSRNPEERYASAGGFVKALRESTEFAPVSWRTGVLRPAMRSDQHPLPRPSRSPSWAPRAPTSTWSTEEQLRAGMGSGAVGRDRSSDRGGERGRTSVAGAGYEAYDRRGSTPGPGPGYGQASGRQGQPVSERGSWEQQVTRPTQLSERDARMHEARLRVMDEPSYRQGRRSEAPRTSLGRYVLISGLGALLVFGGVVFWDSFNGSGSASSADDLAATAAPVPGPGVGQIDPATAPQRPTTQSAGSNVRTRGPGAQAPAAHANAANAPAPAAPNEPNPTPFGLSAATALAAPAARDTVDPAAMAVPGVAAQPTDHPTLDAPAQAPQPGAEAADPTAAATATAAVGATQARPGAGLPAAQVAQVVPKAHATSNVASSGRRVAQDAPPPIPDAPPEPQVDVATIPGGHDVVPPVMVLTPDVAPAAEPAAVQEPAKPSAAEPAPSTTLTRKASEALLRGEVSRAVELARAATDLDPSYELGWRTLGLALERSGTNAAAIAAYEEYLRRAPGGPQSEMVRQRIQSLTR